MPCAVFAMQIRRCAVAVMSKPICDADARRQALDPGSSFIVQAPAGSGKTELLTQRFLRLLAIVDDPEEIVALTFTRKAAAEMSARITTALRDAESGDAPESENDCKRLSLATDALRRDRELGWDLLENPQRLRTMTIDAFNGSLVRQMPLLSQMGPLALTSATMVAGAVPLLLIAMPEILATNLREISAASWGGLLYSTAMALVFGYLAWSRGLQLIGSARTSIYVNLIPVVATVTAWVWLDERLSPRQLAGAATVILGIALSRRLAANANQ